MDEQGVWHPSQYNLSTPPSVKTTLHITPDPNNVGNFPRVVKWSPDGSTVLAQCENGNFEIFELSSKEGDEKQSESLAESPTRTFPQPGPILDYIWYPTATPHDPASFCFVASVRECPVKLLDASDGRLRASYKIVDHRERQIAPHSLAFDLTAQKLYCGFEDAIEIFDLSRPGEGTRLHTTPSKKSKDGLKGIISSLAFSPSYSPDECFYAAGSFNPTEFNIAMFSDAKEEPIMYVGGGPRAGVTQLQFNPMKPHLLYAAYRGCGTGMVYSWDVRSDLDTPLEIFQVSSVLNAKSDVRTNQKMRFDVDIGGRFLSVGDQLGNISIFDLETRNEAENDMHTLNSDSNAPTGSRSYFLPPVLEFKAHDDAVGSVAFHPFESRLLSASGSRHFIDDDELEDSEDSEDDDDDAEGASDGGGASISHSKESDSRWESRKRHPVTLESTLKLWNFGNADILNKRQF